MRKQTFRAFSITSAVALTCALAGTATPLCAQIAQEAPAKTNLLAVQRSSGFPAEHGRPIRVKGGDLEFVVPLRYFRDHVPPSSSSEWYLWVLRPAFTPWRSNNAADDAAFNEPGGGQVVGLLVNFTRQDASQTLDQIISLQKEHGVNPSGRPIVNPNALSNRTTGDLVHGLTPYYIDFGKVNMFMSGMGEHRLIVSANDERRLRWQDWFIQRNTQGQISTLIFCETREVSEQQATEMHRFPHCVHYFLLNKSYQAYASFHYRRVYLADWQAMEFNAKTLLDMFRAAVN